MIFFCIFRNIIEHSEAATKIYKDKWTYNEHTVCFSARKERKDGKWRKEIVRILIRALQRTNIFMREIENKIY